MSLLLRWCDTVGDHTGSKSFNGNYAGAVEQALAQPGAGEVFYVNRVVVSIEDTITFAVETYGALAALTNGIQIKAANSKGDFADFTAGIPIKNLADWAALCGDAVQLHSWGVLNQVFVAVLDFQKMLGGPLALDGDNSDHLYFELNDNFTGLTDHKFMVQGVIK